MEHTATRTRNTRKRCRASAKFRHAWCFVAAIVLLTRATGSQSFQPTNPSPSIGKVNHKSNNKEKIARRERHRKQNRPDRLTLSASTAIPPSSDFFSSWRPTQPRHSNDPVSESYQRAAEQWASKYCSVSGLRECFGVNKHWWGDFDATTTRQLYKSLMPVALLELYETGVVDPVSLAPLAYRARLAAKLYARERCQVPSRLAAQLFDGYRQWRKYGTFDCTGMSYAQVWDKYAATVIEESSSDDITQQICLKILERSCKSNEMIDKLVLKEEKKESMKPSDLAHLTAVSEQLEDDVRQLLQEHMEENDTARQIQTFKALRAVATVKRRIANLKNSHRRRKD